MLKKSSYLIVFWMLISATLSLSADQSKGFPKSSNEITGYNYSSQLANAHRYDKKNTPPKKRVDPSTQAAELEQAAKQKSHYKKLIRIWEAGLVQLRKAKHGANYKEIYFKRAMHKKRLQAKNGEYPEFSRTGKITTSIHIGDTSQLPKGDKIYIGILPSAELLARIKQDIAKVASKHATHREKLRIVSVIEDFELDQALVDLNLGKQPFTLRGEPTALGKGRFKVELNTNSQIFQNLNITRWHQYSTPDRIMMTQRVLEEAINDVVSSIIEKKFVYVHCKSGKGRSAAVVVGARAAVIIDAAKANGKELSKKQIDTIVDEQIKQLRVRRDIIQVNFGQKTNLKKVLYQRAIL